jgi:hypothetical protein
MIDNLFQPLERKTQRISIELRKIAIINDRAFDKNYIGQLISQFPLGSPPIDVMDNPELHRYELLDGQQRFAAFVLGCMETDDMRLLNAREFEQIVRDLPISKSTIPSIVWPILEPDEMTLFHFWRNRNHDFTFEQKKGFTLALRQRFPQITIEEIAHEVNEGKGTIFRWINYD